MRSEPEEISFAGAFAGALGAVFGFAMGVLVILLPWGGPSSLAQLPLLGGVLLIAAIVVGPATFLLGLPLHWLLELLAGRGRSRDTVYAIGMIAGIPLGVVATAVTLFVLGDGRGLEDPFSSVFGLRLLVPPVTAGLGLGAGCAWAALRGRSR